MDWVRMVESKIRFLIQVLEKNQYINLAHINPQGYEEIKEVYEWKFEYTNLVANFNVNI